MRVIRLISKCIIDATGRSIVQVTDYLTKVHRKSAIDLLTRRRIQLLKKNRTIVGQFT